MTAGKGAITLAVIVWASTLVAAAAKPSGVFFAYAVTNDASGEMLLNQKDQGPAHVTPAGLFVTADTCMVCHSNLVTPAGEDVSIGADWRASMMANSARDPYWMAAVRREVMDHPDAAAAIEDECTVCHMPMTTFPERAAGRKGRFFGLLPTAQPPDPNIALAADGVSCTVCHQIQPTNLGTPASFTGGYAIDVSRTPGTRRVFGPFAVDTGRSRVMQTSSTFQPEQATHVQQSELCATCHTLFTHSLATGAAGARLPEQAPYLEWQQSAFKDTQSCQSCHMPIVEGDMALTQVLGQPRPGFSRHSFRGGNFFMMRMLNRYRADLGVRASPQEMAAAIARTERHLTEDTARVSVARAERSGDLLAIDVDVENLAGHKLPTAYPSRRVWVQLTAQDATGRVVFESGAVLPDGRISGNDNDVNGATYEPHYAEITSADQVQVYESVMVDPAGRVTTGLLTGARYVKDNRLMPKGMPRGGGAADVAVHGAAARDADFIGGQDRVAYRLPLNGAQGEVTVTARLWYQPIGFRWAENLRAYDAPEPRRFVSYWDAMASQSALMLWTDTLKVRQ